MISELGNKILAYLRVQDEPVSGKKISDFCQVSLHTVSNEMITLNDELQDHGMLIRSYISKGYSLEITDHAKATAFTMNYYRKMKRYSYLDIDRNAKAYFIVRFLLTYPKSISTDQLAERMYVSKSTILREIPRIQTFLAEFQLRLNTRRNYGLEIEGDEWNKRMCLLHLEKSYQYLPEAEKATEKYFRQAMMIDEDNSFSHRNRRLIIQLQKELKHITVSALYLPRISYYPMIAKTRQPEAERLSFTEEQIRMAKDDIVWPAAKLLYSRLPAVLQSADNEKDILALSMMMQTYRAITSRDDISPEDYEKYTAEAHEALAWIGIRYNIAYLVDDRLVDELGFYLYSLHRSIIYRIPYDYEGFAPIIKEGIYTADICFEFARFFMNRYRITLTDAQIYGCYYIFNRAIYEHNYPSWKFRIMVSSIYGLACADDIAVRLKEKYSYYIESIDTSVFFGIDAIDPNRYDVLVTDSSTSDVNNAAIPVISFDFLRNKSNADAMESYISAVHRQAALNVFKDGNLVNINIKKRDDLFPLMYDAVKPGMSKEAFIEDMQKKDDLVDSERLSGIVFLSPYAYRSPQAEVYVFVNRRTVVWTKEESRIFLYYNYGNGDRASVEAVNSVLKTFMHMQPGDLDSLYGLSYTEAVSRYMKKVLDR